VTTAGLGVLLLVPGLPASADLPNPLPAKKLIATGWDDPTTGQFRRDAAAFAKLPFDGAVVHVTAEGAPESVGTRPFGSAHSRTPWRREWFARAAEDLRAGLAEAPRDFFVILNANPGDVDWFDEAGWAAIIDHWRIAASVAKRAGARGLLFDPEPYVKPWRQFAYGAQPGRASHAFAAYAAKARERGRAVMRAVAAEYPDAVILNYFLLSFVLDALEGGNPARALPAHGYGLLPAFLDGWLDEIPSSMALVDGCEEGYYLTSPAEFLDRAVRIKGAAQALVASENRAKYRAQVEVGFGIYLDAYANPKGSKYYIGGGGRSRAEWLEANVAGALRAADRYVWIYGEEGRWWPEPGGTGPAPGRRFRPWPKAIPACDRALAVARDPVDAARRRIGELRAAGTLKDLARNGGFDAAKTARNPAPAADWGEAGAPPGWDFWQDEETSRGAFGWDRDAGATVPGSARLAGVTDGCFIQKIRVKPGMRVFATGAAKWQGQGEPCLQARWQDARGKWTAWQKDVIAFASGSGGTWTILEVAATVPEGAGFVVLLPGVKGQASAGDIAWFDDVHAWTY
jgi:hypothetical protein